MQVVAKVVTGDHGNCEERRSGDYKTVGADRKRFGRSELSPAGWGQGEVAALFLTSF